MADSALSLKHGAGPRNAHRYTMTRLNRSNLRGLGRQRDSLAPAQSFRGHPDDRLAMQQLSPRTLLPRDPTLSGPRLSSMNADTEQSKVQTKGPDRALPYQKQLHHAAPLPERSINMSDDACDWSHE